MPIKIAFWVLLIFHISYCHSNTAASRQIETQSPPLITPIVINGTEKDAQILVIEDNDQIYIHLIDFLSALKLKHQFTNQQIHIETAIGTAHIAELDTYIINGQMMVSLTHLSDKLAMYLSLDKKTFAIIARAKWWDMITNIEQATIKPSGKVKTPDIKSANNSIAYIRNEYYYREDDNNQSTTAETEMGGRLLGGAWQFRASNYIDNDPYFEDYVWVQTRTKHRLLLGNQIISLNPLLGGTDFTGAQIAWSNQGIDLFLRNVSNNQLISDPRSPIRTFKGEGIGGGVVELRVEDVPVAETIALLDNTFIFRDIKIPTGSYVKIEAWVFAPNTSGIPEKIIDFSRYNTNQNLPEKTLLLQAGAGLNGNIIEQANNELENFFYTRAQYAVNSNFVIESILQSIDNHNVALIGSQTYLGKLGFWEIDLAADENDNAWRIQSSNRGKYWFYRTSAQYRPDNWMDTDLTSFNDYSAEVGWQFNTYFDFSVLARQYQFAEQDVDFVLPAVSWRPTQNLAFSARPDFNGDYSYRAYWQISRKQRISAIANESSSTSIHWRYAVNSRNSFDVLWLDRKSFDQDQQRLSAMFTHNSVGLQSLGWSIGLLAGEHHMGYLASVDYEFIPGLRVRAQLLRDPITARIDDELDTILGINMIANFNLGKGGYYRGGYYQALDNTGSISGKIKSPEGTDYEFNDIKILINGQVRTQVGELNRFTIPYIDPGIYEVKLDWSSLPLEMEPVRDTFWVEVAAGSNTSVVFETQLYYGANGTITDQNSRIIADTYFEVQNLEGTKITDGSTNRFGQFRIDQLKPGHYQIKINELLSCPIMTVTNAYLTNQIIQLTDNPSCQ